MLPKWHLLLGWHKAVLQLILFWKGDFRRSPFGKCTQLIHCAAILKADTILEEATILAVCELWLILEWHEVTLYKAVRCIGWVLLER